MDMLVSWNEQYKCSYHFIATAVIQDVSGKIIGSRFVNKGSQIIVDIPLNSMTTLAASLDFDYPKSVSDMNKTYLSPEFLRANRFSPWHTAVNSISLEAHGKLNATDIVVFKDGFMPVDKDSLNGYTTFICPAMVFRIPDLSIYTLESLELVNDILYNTRFVKTFGISSIVQLAFIGNLGTICTMHSYKIEDTDFLENFEFLVEEFCDEYGIPRHSRAIYIDGISIILNIDCLKNYYTSPCPSEIPKFMDVRQVPRLGKQKIGIVSEVGFKYVTYLLPNEENRKLFGLPEWKTEDNCISIYDEEFAVKNVSSLKPSSLRRIVKLKEGKYLYLVNCIPSAGFELIDGMFDLMHEAFDSSGMEILSECIKTWKIPDVSFEFPGSSKQIVIAKDAIIDETAFGENNEYALKQMIADGYVDFMEERKLSASCKINEGSTITFKLKMNA